ncbi:MAG TPA: phosphotransferase [Bradyrhizobium sp.]|nr:phosphotransferase [Bradyrhizobium sp.]
MDDAGLMPRIALLLEAAGVAPEGFRARPCAAGGNNRVFRVDVGGRALVAKCYFRDPWDSRDRLNAEFSFLEYARKAGIDCVPEPIALDDDAGIGLYEFIDGDKLSPGAVAPEHIEQAREFFVRLNEPARRVLAGSLTGASESCFSISDHLALVQGRIDRLSTIPTTSKLDREAAAFAAELRTRWAGVRARVSSELERKGLEQRSVLSPEDRCISPSDFGFHNAIVSPSGKLVFIDFEYSGWDDPAKAVSDFFSQPAIPVQFDHFDSFLASALTYSPDADMLAVRTRLLLPVFQLKWCCIVMNDFLPALVQRRRFADPARDETRRKHVQLEKARRLLQLIRH